MKPKPNERRSLRALSHVLRDKPEVVERVQWPVRELAPQLRQRTQFEALLSLDEHELAELRALAAEGHGIEALLSLDEHELAELRALAAEAHGIEPRKVRLFELSSYVHSIVLELVRDGALVRRARAAEGGR